MASGHVNRIYRPNTWLHRPSLRREDFSCQPGSVHTWQLVLQMSKIERRRKSREGRILDDCDAATPCSSDTEVSGRSCGNQCGPSRPHAQNASAVLRNFRRQPKKTFATLSAQNGHGAMSDLSPLYGQKGTSGLLDQAADRSNHRPPAAARPFSVA